MNQGSLPHDINGIVLYQTPWYYYALGILAGVLCAAVIFAFLKRRKPKPDVKTEIKVDPLLLCRQSLRSLEPKQPFTRMMQIEFFHKLSLLLREYLEHSFHLPATDLTTKELREKLPKYSQIKNHNEIVKFLDSADSIKFAEKEVSVSEAELNRDTVIGWIDQFDKKNLDQVEQHPGFEFTQREQT